ncbi:hypothetical protein [Nocardia thailandica]
MSTHDGPGEGPGPRVLPRAGWQGRAEAHRERIDALIGPYLARRAAGTTHPVVDFLFT